MSTKVNVVICICLLFAISCSCAAVTPEKDGSGSFREAFGGRRLDTTRWSVSSSPNMEVTENYGLWFSAAGREPRYRWARLTHNQSLPSEFDLEVYWFADISENYSRLGLQVRDEDASYGIYRAELRSGKAEYQIVRISSGRSETVAKAPATGKSGSFRCVRSGGLVHWYYKDTANAEWAELGSVEVSKDKALRLAFECGAPAWTRLRCCFQGLRPTGEKITIGSRRANPAYVPQPQVEVYPVSKAQEDAVTKVYTVKKTNVTATGDGLTISKGGELVYALELPGNLSEATLIVDATRGLRIEGFLPNLGEYAPQWDTLFLDSDDGLDRQERFEVDLSRTLFRWSGARYVSNYQAMTSDNVLFLKFEPETAAQTPTIRNIRLRVKGLKQDDVEGNAVAKEISPPVRKDGGYLLVPIDGLANCDKLSRPGFRDFERFPEGQSSIGGIPFLFPTAKTPSLLYVGPGRSYSVKIQRKAEGVSFLWAGDNLRRRSSPNAGYVAEFGGGGKSLFGIDNPGFVRLKYEDGTSHIIFIKLGWNINNWFKTVERFLWSFMGPIELPKARIGWMANAAATTSGWGEPFHALFRADYLNPFPHKTIDKIEFHNTASNCGFVVAGLTLAQEPFKEVVPHNYLVDKDSVSWSVFSRGTHPGDRVAVAPVVSGQDTGRHDNDGGVANSRRWFYRSGNVEMPRGIASGRYCLKQGSAVSAPLGFLSSDDRRKEGPVLQMMMDCYGERQDPLHGKVFEDYPAGSRKWLVRMARQGYRSVRLLYKWHHAEPEPGKYQFKGLIDTIEYSRDLGMASRVAMHTYGTSRTGSYRYNVPDWRYHQDSYTLDNYGNPSAFLNPSFFDDLYIDGLVQLWGNTAEALKGMPGVEYQLTFAGYASPYGVPTAKSPSGWKGRPDRRFFFGFDDIAQDAWRQSLKRKWTLGDINKRYGSDFSSWQEIRVPERKNYVSPLFVTDYLLFRKRHVDTVFNRIAGEIRKTDADTAIWQLLGDISFCSYNYNGAHLDDYLKRAQKFGPYAITDDQGTKLETSMFSGPIVRKYGMRYGLEDKPFCRDQLGMSWSIYHAAYQQAGEVSNCAGWDLVYPEDLGSKVPLWMQVLGKERHSDIELYLNQGATIDRQIIFRDEVQGSIYTYYNIGYGLDLLNLSFEVSTDFMPDELFARKRVMVDCANQFIPTRDQQRILKHVANGGVFVSTDQTTAKQDYALLRAFGLTPSGRKGTSKVLEGGSEVATAGGISFADEGQVLLRWQDGLPAAVLKQHGKGFLLAYGFNAIGAWGNSAPLRRQFIKILSDLGWRQQVVIDGGGIRLKAAWFTAKSKAEPDILLIGNKSAAASSGLVLLPAELSAEAALQCRDMSTGKISKAVRKDGRWAVPIQVGPWDWTVVEVGQQTVSN